MLLILPIWALIVRESCRAFHFHRPQFPVNPYFHEYLRAPECATVARFYMAPRTRLSAATLSGGISTPRLSLLATSPRPGEEKVCPPAFWRANRGSAIRNPSKALKT